MQIRFFRWLDQQLSTPQRHFPVLKRGSYHEHPDMTVHSYGTSESIHYSEPFHFGNLLPEYINTVGIAEYPAPFVLDVKNGKIYGRHALVTTADNQIVAESLFNHLPYLDLISSGRVHFPENGSQFIGQLTYSPRYETVYVLANYFGNAFYHWTLETLPRLWLLQQYQEATGQTIPVLVNQAMPDFARQTLDLFGIQDVLFWDATYAHVEQLLMPMAINGTGIPSPRIMRLVSDQLASEIGTLPRFDSPRIYITRKNYHKRRVINEDAVIALLEKHGFEVFALEDMSLAEQIALFQQAELVIGAHGAAFANCIHSKQIKLLEFFEPSYINLCFYRLACGYGFDYGYLVGQSEGLNIILDVDALERMMQTMQIIE